jgi:MoaA/NifB/PqqE/SkfB family radical SAM enzyme
MYSPKLSGGCFFTTLSCNMKCPICYSVLENPICYPPLSKVTNEMKKKIIDRMFEIGLNKIMFTGGEPLLDSDMPNLIKYAKSKGLKTGLSTNGLLLSENVLEKLNDCLDELTLPLDGPTPFIHCANRGSKEHFFVITDLLRIVGDYNFKTDIGTVVTRFNINHLQSILDLLLYFGIEKWKLFQFGSIGRGSLNPKKYQVSDYEFMEIRKQLSENSKIEIDFRNNDESVMKSYFNVLSSGDIFMVSNNKNIIIGNILNNENIYHILKTNNFNFEIHNKRHWRDY